MKSIRIKKSESAEETVDIKEHKHIERIGEALWIPNCWITLSPAMNWAA